MDKRVSLNIISEYRNEMFGLSALIITLFHGVIFTWPASAKGIFEAVQLGEMGVDIFCFLSGMGLYYSLKRDGKLLNFYRKRLLRVLPGYLLMAIPGYFVLDYILRGQGIKVTIASISTLNYWFGISRGGGGLWFVSFILLWYLVFPLIYKIMEGRKRIIIYMMVVISLIIGVMVCPRLSNDYYYLYLPISRIPISLIGCAFAEGIYERRNISILVPIISAVLFITGKAVMENVELNKVPPMSKVCINLYLFTFGTLFFIFMIPWLLSLGKAKESKLSRVLCFLGEISLEIYIAHDLIRWIYIESAFGRGHSSVLIYYAILIPIAIIIAKVVRIIAKRVETIFDRKHL